jgi:hypothetical protein
MARNLQFIIFILLFTVVSVSAQLSIVTDQNFYIEGTPDNPLVTGKIDVQMGGTALDAFDWELITSEDIPQGWVYSVCVGETCYIPGLYNSPETVLIEMNESELFTIYLNPNGVEGVSTLNFIFKTTDGEEIMSQELTYDIATASSTDELETGADLVLFPNPTTDFFNISNDDDIAQVSVFNILGKEMFTYNHEAGQAYSVADFDDGYYLTRLIDNTGKSLKVIRFNKTSKN